LGSGAGSGVAALFSFELALEFESEFDEFDEFADASAAGG
jgi:hypothetical protein